jgi:hypothetical protein
MIKLPAAIVLTGTREMRREGDFAPEGESGMLSFVGVRLWDFGGLSGVPEAESCLECSEVAWVSSDRIVAKLLDSLVSMLSPSDSTSLAGEFRALIEASNPAGSCFPPNRAFVTGVF